MISVISGRLHSAAVSVYYKGIILRSLN